MVEFAEQLQPGVLFSMGRRNAGGQRGDVRFFEVVI
jgi:hypothetical protein